MPGILVGTDYISVNRTDILVHLEIMIWQRADSKQKNRYFPTAISTVYGRNEKGEVTESYGKTELLLHCQKRVVRKDDLEAEKERSYRCQELIGRANALQCEQLVYEELKECLEMSKGESGMEFERQKEIVLSRV